MSQYVQPPHFCCLPATILYAVVSILFNGGKMAPLANCSHFPCGGLSFCSCAARHTVPGIHDARAAAT